MTYEAPPGWMFIGPYMVPKPPKLFIAAIQDRVAAARKTTRRDIISSRRSRDLSLSRHIAMYLARTLTPSSYPEIGRRFGGRDHTTVMHAVNRIGGLMEADRELREHIRTLAEGLAA